MTLSQGLGAELQWRLMLMRVEDSPQTTPIANPTFEVESELCTGTKMDGCPGVFDDPDEEL